MRRSDSSESSEEEEEPEVEEEAEADTIPLISSPSESELASRHARIQIKPFIPGHTPPNNKIFQTITVYGRRRTGKSVFIKWDMQAYKHLIPWWWAFTKTQLNSYYETFIPKKFILDDISSHQLEEIMERQRVARMLMEEADEKGLRPINPLIGIVWDDVSGKDIRYNEILAAYYYTGRHFMSRNYFAAQHVTLTPPPIRSNTDLVVIFNTDHRPSMETHWENFAGQLEKDVWFQVLQKGTIQPHTFLAIDANPNVPFTERFYSGKAKVLEAELEYIMGCAQYWQDSVKQLQKIASGKYKRRAELFDGLADWKPPGYKPTPPKMSQTTGSLRPEEYPCTDVFVECGKKGNLKCDASQLIPNTLLSLGPTKEE